MFPERSRVGDPAHESAVGRLAVARGEQRRLAVDAQAARGTHAENQTARRSRGATDDVAAREAWVGWIERGV